MSRALLATFGALLILLFTSSPEAVGAAFTKKSFMIRQDRFLSFGPEGPDLEIETLIFRDGLVTTRLHQIGGGFTYWRFHATADLLSDLRRSLQTNEVGQQEGDCLLLPGPNQAETYRDLVTWFGKEGRQHSFTVGTELTAGGNCPEETRAIIMALDTFEARALNQDREAERVDVPSKPPKVRSAPADLGRTFVFEPNHGDPRR